MIRSKGVSPKFPASTRCRGFPAAYGPSFTMRLSGGTGVMASVRMPASIKFTPSALLYGFLFMCIFAVKRLPPSKYQMAACLIKNTRKVKAGEQDTWYCPPHWHRLSSSLACNACIEKEFLSINFLNSQTLCCFWYICEVGCTICPQQRIENSSWCKNSMLTWSSSSLVMGAGRGRGFASDFLSNSQITYPPTKLPPAPAHTISPSEETFKPPPKFSLMAPASSSQKVTCWTLILDFVILGSCQATLKSIKTSCWLFLWGRSSPAVWILSMQRYVAWV